METHDDDYRRLVEEHRAFVANESNYYQAFIKYKTLFYSYRGEPERHLILELLMKYYNKIDQLEEFSEPEDCTDLANEVNTYRELVNTALQGERDKFFQASGLDPDSIALANMWMPPYKIN